MRLLTFHEIPLYMLNVSSNLSEIGRSCRREIHAAVVIGP